MASAGQISMHAQQSMQLRSSTPGRNGAITNAPVGQVAKHAPHAVHLVVMETVTLLPGSRAGSPCGNQPTG
jgi:hypothetical protein